jgi:hypothetical protein
MTKKALRDIVEAVLKRLATEETPRTACLWWDSAPPPCNDCQDCTDCQDIVLLYGITCSDNPYPNGTRYGLIQRSNLS